MNDENTKPEVISRREDEPFAVRASIPLGVEAPAP